VLLGRFARVTGLVDPPAALLRPGVMLRVLSVNRRQRGTSSGPATGPPAATDTSAAAADSATSAPVE
jgi:hypothetical protein